MDEKGADDLYFSLLNIESREETEWQKKRGQR